MRIIPVKIVRALRRNNGQIRKTARLLGISPGTVINWKKRLGNRGPSYEMFLERESTRPRHVRGNVIDSKTGHRIIRLRDKTGFGARKLKYLLDIPAHWSSIHRSLKDHNCIPEQTHYRRPKLQPTTHMHARNAVAPGKLQMDVKYITPQLSGLRHTVYLYAVMDIFSRYKQGVILPVLDQKTAILALKHALPQLPFNPDFIQTDNGLEFQEEFHNFVTGMGWHHHYLHKSAPNENGVIERSFRTDEEEFFFFRYRRAKDINDLNLQYQLYMHEYNTERPHLSLDMLTPVEKLRSVQNV